MESISSRIGLTDISELTLTALLDGNAQEDVYFDFKEGVERGDERHKYIIRRALSSFANTFGGFVFFGVKDSNSGVEGHDRIVGVPRSDEFGKRLSQKYLQGRYCVPPPDFEGPVVLTIDGKYVPVIKVLRGDKGPYAIRRALDTPLEFWERSSGTGRPMEYPVLMASAERFREERQWILALWADVITVVGKSQYNLDVVGRGTGMVSAFSTFLMHDSANVLRVLGTDEELVKRVLDLREQIYRWNEQRDDFMAILPRFGPESIPQVNVAMRGPTEAVRTLATALRDHLAEHYPITREYIQRFTWSIQEVPTELGDSDAPPHD